MKKFILVLALGMSSGCIVASGKFRLQKESSDQGIVTTTGVEVNTLDLRSASIQPATLKKTRGRPRKSVKKTTTNTSVGNAVLLVEKEVTPNILRPSKKIRMVESITLKEAASILILLSQNTQAPQKN